MTLVESPKAVHDLPDGLLERIVARLNPVRVILFGSRASGTQHPGSDWDLLVVVDDETRPEQVDWQVMGEVLKVTDKPVDLIPMRHRTFRERGDVIGSLAWIASHKGVPVYERADAL